jgi:hypothetical protein
MELASSSEMEAFPASGKWGGASDGMIDASLRKENMRVSINSVLIKYLFLNVISSVMKNMARFGGF